MKENTKARYAICLKCCLKKTEGMDIHKDTAEKIQGIIRVGLAKKWYNPYSGALEVCQGCKNSGLHRAYDDGEQKNYTYVRM